MTTSTNQTGSLDAATVRRFLDGDQHLLRERLRELLSGEQFAPVSELPRAEYRTLAQQRVDALGSLGWLALGAPAASSP
jgi:hypothetical protein